MRLFCLLAYGTGLCGTTGFLTRWDCVVEEMARQKIVAIASISFSGAWLRVSFYRILLRVVKGPCFAEACLAACQEACNNPDLEGNARTDSFLCVMLSSTRCSANAWEPPCF